MDMKMKMAVFDYYEYMSSKIKQRRATYCETVMYKYYSCLKGEDKCNISMFDDKKHYFNECTNHTTR